MSLILNIDSSGNTAHVSLAKAGKVLSHMFNNEQKDHAGFIQPAIKNILQKTDISIHDINAVCVTFGPGSYTGLRVGMASAKGLCYSLNIPLITISTLEVLAKTAINSISGNRSMLFVPMIDARRMEVYTAVYDSDLKAIMNPENLILENASFQSYLNSRKTVFFGDGATKWQKICNHSNAGFIDITISSDILGTLSFEKFSKKEFSDTAYSVPLYLKEFYSAQVNRDE